MLKAGNKHPLKECLGENSGPSRPKRCRFDNIVLLREAENSGSLNSEQERNREGGPPRQILRAGRKRKKPSDEGEPQTTSISDIRNGPDAKATTQEKDENDIISELTKEFKKARLRPVFFTISSFIEQTVDEVGFTLGDEAETEVTIRLNLTRSIEENCEVTEEGSHLSTDKEQKEAHDLPNLVSECSEDGNGAP